MGHNQFLHDQLGQIVSHFRFLDFQQRSHATRANLHVYIERFPVKQPVLFRDRKFDEGPRENKRNTYLHTSQSSRNDKSPLHWLCFLALAFRKMCSFVPSFRGDPLSRHNGWPNTSRGACDPSRGEPLFLDFGRKIADESVEWRRGTISSTRSRYKPPFFILDVDSRRMEELNCFFYFFFSLARNKSNDRIWFLIYKENWMIREWFSNLEELTLYFNLKFEVLFLKLNFPVLLLILCKKERETGERNLKEISYSLLQK